MRTLILASAAAVALAGCPNQCSGHGSCGGADECTCFANWMGPDCSQRICEFGNAWAVDDVNPHSYAECSAQGICNRQSGECECFDGFSGRACARSLCPNDCSGHGVCRLLGEMEQAYEYDAANWDSERIQACDCDSGFYGPDCSMRYCPSGDDPLTFCRNSDPNAKKHVQQIRVVLGSETVDDLWGAALASSTASTMEVFHHGSTSTSRSALAAQGEVILNYFTPYGDKYTTHAISNVFDADLTQVTDTDGNVNDIAGNVNARDRMEIALETLPDQVVKDVVVSTTLASVGFNGGIANIPMRVYQVTFVPDETNSINMGLMNTMSCETGYACDEPGCQPKVKMPFLYRYAKQTGTTISYKTGDKTSIASHFVQLTDDSQPQMPAGIPVDTLVTDSNDNRYDIRIVVVVEDPSNTNNDAIDHYYVRVVAGHNNIMSDKEAIFGEAGVFTTGSAGTIDTNGFTYMGPIPAGTDRIPVPGAPGAYLKFASQNAVADGVMEAYEILVKLPHCEVVAFEKVDDSTYTFSKLVENSDLDLNLGGSPVKPEYVAPILIDEQIENIECSGRGMCNRQTGQCQCFEGYYGLACHRQTTLI